MKRHLAIFVAFVLCVTPLFSYRTSVPQPSDDLLAYQSGRVRQEIESQGEEVKANTSGRKVPEEWFIAGEALTIRIPADSSSILNGGYPIDAEGYVDLPILGKVFVTDKNRKEFQAFLKAQLAHYMKDTHITARPAIRISFLGGFLRPGMHYIHPDDVVWDAFIRSGGVALQVQVEEEIHKMLVMRGSQKLHIKPLDIFSSGLTLREAGILSGDIFVMPIPIEKKGFWLYFKDGVSVFASVISVAASLMTTYLLWYQIQLQNQ